MQCQDVDISATEYTHFVHQSVSLADVDQSNDHHAHQTSNCGAIRKSKSVLKNHEICSIIRYTTHIHNFWDFCCHLVKN